MQILHIVPSYLPAWRYGGTIQSVHGICKSLAKRGHDVQVYTTNVDGPNDSQVDLRVPVDIDGVKVWYFPSKHLRRIYWSPEMKSKLMRTIRNFDILHLHSVFLWPTWMAARIAEKNSVPYVVSPRGMLVKELIGRKNRHIKAFWIHWIEKETLRKASAIHMTSKLESSEAKRLGLNLAPIYVVPNGIDIEEDMDRGVKNEFSPDFLSNKPSAAKPFLLYLGRINWKKGLDRLIPALRFVPEASLAIVGNDEEGYTPFLKKLSEEAGVSDRVSFHEPIYSSKKQALYRSASIFVLPSHSENFGNAVLEAMAAGCPVVVTPEVGLADAVLEVGAGLVVDGDPQSLGQNLRDLIVNEPLRRKMGEAGRRAVKERFTWGTVSQEMEGVYRAVLMEADRK